MLSLIEERDMYVAGECLLNVKFVRYLISEW